MFMDGEFLVKLQLYNNVFAFNILNLLKFGGIRLIHLDLKFWKTSIILRIFSGIFREYKISQNMLIVKPKPFLLSTF